MSLYDAKSLAIEGKAVHELVINGEKVFPKLPEGYIELQYIQSAASQYIKTGVYPNPNYTVTAEFSIAQKAAVWDTIFGTRNANAARFTARYANTTTGKLGIHRSTAKGNNYESYEDAEAAKDKVTGAFHHIRLAKNKYYFDRTLKKTFTASTSTAAFPYELYLFANNNAGKVGDAGYFRMKYCTIQDETGKYVRYYIPCKNPSGVAGMYDFIEDKFYGSSSTKAFTAGSVREVV